MLRAHCRCQSISAGLAVPALSSLRTARQRKLPRVLIQIGRVSGRPTRSASLGRPACAFSSKEYLGRELAIPDCTAIQSKGKIAAVRASILGMEVRSEVWIALLLTVMGSCGTALGGMLVVLQPTPNMQRLGLMQGFAAGLMLSISFFDLVPEAIEAVGFKLANLWFFAGVLMFWAVVQFIPEPELAPEPDEVGIYKKTDGDLADSDKGSKGLVQRGPENGKSLDETSSNSTREQRRQVMYSGIITAIGISLHNFPEGIAVFLGSMKGIRVGITLAVAIALHNIPEGVAVALPVYYATESKWRGFRLAALSGLAEPLAVLFVALFFPASLSKEIIEGMLGGVGGIMAFLTLHEMLPLAFEYAGHRPAVVACFLGMAVMSASLWLLEISLPA